MRPPPPPYLPWLDEVGGSRAGSRSGAGDIDQQESAFSLAFGDVTVLGGSRLGDQQAYQTHTPDSEKLPNPLGLQVLVLAFFSALVL